MIILYIILTTSSNFNFNSNIQNYLNPIYYAIATPTLTWGYMLMKTYYWKYIGKYSQFRIYCYFRVTSGIRLESSHLGHIFFLNYDYIEYIVYILLQAWVKFHVMFLVEDKLKIRKICSYWLTLVYLTSLFQCKPFIISFISGNNSWSLGKYSTDQHNYKMYHI